MASPSPELHNAVDQWLQWDKNDTTRREIEELTNDEQWGKLNAFLLQRMSFGTAGLRARMGAGNSQMNDLTVIQTTQGFAHYMLQATPEVKTKGVVVGFDGRHNSDRWGRVVANILTTKGIPCRLFSTICPTPYVYGHQWGIMITASHNPKEDNGYKVYAANGAQIVSPHDKGITEGIAANLAPLSSSWDYENVRESSLCLDGIQEVHDAYMSALQPLIHHSSTNSSSPVRITYTAMHGVGYKAVRSAMATFALPEPIPVLQQVEADPEFPTVRFPNPEEGRSALDLAMSTADANESCLILANDPDADRLAVAEKTKTGWRVFTGNETGTLLGHWLFLKQREAKPDQNVSDLYFLASTVSSKMLRAVAEKEGLKFEETLTGFKWMGNRTVQLQAIGKTVLFAFEEAIGYMCGTAVLDKDGVSAAAVCAEMAAQLYSKGLTLSQQLEHLYETYGNHITNNSYFFCYEPKDIVQLFEEIRNFDGTGKYPEKCGEYSIKSIRDLTTGYDSGQANGKAVLPTSKSSQMITFTFNNGVVMTLRTSGTEPKIKYYAEYCAAPSVSDNRENLTRELEDLVHNVILRFLKPEKFGLKPKEN